MKSVFILGAGASKAAGGPLMSGFLDRAFALHRQDPPGNDDVARAFQDVDDGIVQLGNVHIKSYLDLDNLEEVFGAVEMAGLIGKLAERSEQQITTLHDSIITVIVRTLEQSMDFPVKDGTIYPPSAYDQFVKMLVSAKEERKTNEPQEYAFVTFNYDVALDFALHFNRVDFDYCFDERPSRDPLPYLKLHGSINWGTCSECPDTVVPYHMSDASFSTWPGKTKFAHLNMGSKIGHKRHGDHPLNAQPLIVPPTWNKTAHHHRLVNVWRRAATELEAAENIFVIGYSVPDTDMFFRYLFALGIQGPARIQRFWVFDPDSRVGERFERMLGGDTRKKYKFHEDRFENSLGIILEALRSP